MRHRFLPDAGLRHSSVSSEGARPATIRKRSTAQRFSLEFLESRCLLSLISGNVTPYALPLSGGNQLYPADITATGGKLWVAESTSAGGGAIGMVDPGNSASISTYTQGLSGAVASITSGPYGDAWFTEPSASKIGYITTTGTTHPIQEVTLPSGAEPQGIAANVGTSTIWYADTGNNKIGSISVSANPANPPVVNPEITIPNGSVPANTPIVVGTDPHGTLWFAEYNASTALFAIGSYDPVTQHWAQVPLGSGQQPYGLAVGPGGSIWFSEAVSSGSASDGFGSSALEVINPSNNNSLTSYPIALTPVGAVLPYRLVEGPDGNIWFTVNNETTISQTNGPGIGEFNVTSHAFAMETVPQAPGVAFPPAPTGITVGTDPANSNIQSIWVTDIVGAVDVKLLASQLVLTSPPAATVSAGNTVSLGVTAKDPSGYVDPTFIGSVTLTESSGTHVSLAANQGVANFTNVALPTTAGGYTLTATAAGLSATPAFGVNVVAAQASQLKISESPPNSINAGSGFNVAVTFSDSYQNPTTYTGTISVALASNPSNILATATVGNGSSASFPTLTLNNPGTYQLVFSAGGLSSATSQAFTVQQLVQPAAPYVLPQNGATVLTNQKYNKKHKPIGKPTLQGYEFTFNAAMNTGSTGNRLNYLVQTYTQVRVKVGKTFKKELKLTPIGFSVSVPSNNAVKLVLAGKQAFKFGGQISLIATAPSGLSGADGAYLSGTVTFNIARGGFGISPA